MKSLNMQNFPDFKKASNSTSFQPFYWNSISKLSTLNTFQKKDVTSEQFNPFPHTTNLQQTTMNTSGQKYEKYLNMKVYLLNRVENITENE